MWGGGGGGGGGGGVIHNLNCQRGGPGPGPHWGETGFHSAVFITVHWAGSIQWHQILGPGMQSNC